MDTGTCYT